MRKEGIEDREILTVTWMKRNRDKSRIGEENEKKGERK